MVGSGRKARAESVAAGPRRASAYYRRPLGRWWLLFALLVPIVLVGVGAALGPATTAVHPAGKHRSAAAKTGAGVAPLSIIRSDNNVTASGDVPNDDAKNALVAALKAGFGDDANIVDQIHVVPATKALDFAKADTVFKAAAPVPNFSLVVEGDTITLTGTAPTTDQDLALVRAAKAAWSNLEVADSMEIKAAAPGTAAPPVPAPAEAPPPAPTAPGEPQAAPPPAAAPGRPPGDPCANLQPYLVAVIGGPVYFGNDGVSLTAPVQQALSLAATRLKACPNVGIAVNGYTDNSGSAALNVALSDQRANTVADFLVSQGVPRSQIVAKGLGSINPIADNSTPSGRAKNRRAEVVVS